MKFKLLTVLIFVIILSLIIFAFFSETIKGEVVATVTGKDRIVKEESSFWIILTDQEPLMNRDSLVNMKFNSSDFQGLIHQGTKYRFIVTGFRIPYLSVYRNIISYELVDN